MKYKILMLCVRFPYPPRDGGAIAMNNMIKAFHSEGHEVTVFAMNTPKHYVHLRDLPPKVLERAEYHAVDINTSPRRLDLLANLFFSEEAYHVERFTSKGFTATLDSLLKEKSRLLEKEKGNAKEEPYDFVQLETIYMVPYVPILRKYLKKAKIILRAHNIEHEIWERSASNATSPFKQYYYSVTHSRIKAFELGVIQNKKASLKIDAIVPVTKRDADTFKKLKATPPIRVSGVGLDVGTLAQKVEELKKSLKGIKEEELKKRDSAVCYIGSMDWKPNQEGIDWFLKKVWPQVSSQHPESTFHLAGRNMPNFYRSIKEKQVQIEGEVEDAHSFMFDKGIMVVPLHSGSGIRVKILEGLALKKAIVATPVAVEGINVKHGEHLLIAETPQEFINCISILLEKPSLGKTLGDHGAKLMEQSFDYHKLVKDLTDFYASLK